MVSNNLCPQKIGINSKTLPLRLRVGCKRKYSPDPDVESTTKNPNSLARINEVLTKFLVQGRSEDQIRFFMMPTDLQIMSFNQYHEPAFIEPSEEMKHYISKVEDILDKVKAFIPEDSKERLYYSVCRKMEKKLLNESVISKEEMTFLKLIEKVISKDMRPVINKLLQGKAEVKDGVYGNNSGISLMTASPRHSKYKINWHKDEFNGDISCVYTFRDQPTTLYLSSADKYEYLKTREVTTQMMQRCEEKKFAIFFADNAGYVHDDFDGASLMHAIPAEKIMDGKHRTFFTADFSVIKEDLDSNSDY